MNQLLARTIIVVIRLACYASVALAIFMAFAARPGPLGNLPWLSTIGAALGGIVLTIIAECLLDLVEIARDKARRTD